MNELTLKSLNSSAVRKQFPKQVITMVLASLGPMKVYDLQRSTKLRRSVFLRALKSLILIGTVRVNGRGIKGRPLMYLLSAAPNALNEATPQKSRLVIV